MNKRHTPLWFEKEKRYYKCWRCKKETKLSKCDYCGKFFCGEHSNPGDHACYPYREYLENKERIQMTINSKVYDKWDRERRADRNKRSIRHELETKITTVSSEEFQDLKRQNKKISISSIITIVILISIAFFAYQNNEIILKTISGGLNFVSEGINNLPIENMVPIQPKINVSQLELEIHDLINTERQNNGLSTLQLDSRLSDIARTHSIDMSLNSYFSHTNLKGQDPTARGNAAGYSCFKGYGSYYTNGLGENIFQNNLYDSVTYIDGVPFYSWNSQNELASSTVSGWMQSPGHRQNILTTTYDREGIGVAISSDNNVYITQDFC
ncbi:MAG: CAP domain-containing protein [Candidatus Aenigmatarchaeota archaeon]